MKRLKKWQIIAIILEVIVLVVVAGIAVKYFIQKNRDSAEEQSTAEVIADSTEEDVEKTAEDTETSEEETSIEEDTSEEESSSEDEEEAEDTDIAEETSEKYDIEDEYEIVLPSGNGSAGM